MHTLVDRGPALPPGHIYLHVPFCTDRCTYCAFATAPDDPSQHLPLVEALLGEWSDSRGTVAILRTLYLGGGTPGLLAPALLEQLLRPLRTELAWVPGAEVTLEVNPANVTREALLAWHELGITRLSVGVQTFDDATLHELARRHDGTTAQRALDLVVQHWPGSWSADLLVGWRDQQPHHLERDLETLLERRPPHVSVYGLTIEPRTALASMAARGARVVADPDSATLEDEPWVRRLEAAGLERYEVSNFSLPDQRSQHNQAYWANLEYLGLGPGASSSLGDLRWSNLASTREYLRRSDRSLSRRDRVERLTPAQRLLESLAAGLRRSEGISKEALTTRFGPSWASCLGPRPFELLSKGLLQETRSSLMVPPALRSCTDAVLAALTAPAASGALH